jgi:hypothetical protein
MLRSFGRVLEHRHTVAVFKLRASSATPLNRIM